ncbi:hypothetical protein ACFQYP_05180 [Nonomuraea antimicrobica]
MSQLRPALFAVALTMAIATPAQAAAGPAITIENGRTQPVFSYTDAIREHVYVESTVDSDLDGALDKVRVDIIRPKESGPGLKVPVIIDESPYYDNSGRGNEGERKVYDAAGNVAKFPSSMTTTSSRAATPSSTSTCSAPPGPTAAPTSAARPTCWAARPSSTG